jgi:hypothetical protein
MKMDTYNKAMSESINDLPIMDGSLINFQNLISQHVPHHYFRDPII